MVSKTVRAILSIFLLGIFFVTPAQADLSQQRQKFLEAEKAFNENKFEDFKSLTAELVSYPLYPYLLHKELRQNISLKSEAQILEFLDAYSSTPLAGQLRSRWLDYLARNHQWTRLVRDYTESSSRERTLCSYGRALLETGQEKAAFDHAEKMWLHGRSRPNECDPLFDAWRAADKLTPELVRERIALAIDQGQLGLAGYLRRYLPDSDKSWLDLWLNIARNPSRTLHQDWTGAADSYSGKILVYGMKRLVRQDTSKAAKDWDAIKAEYNFEATDFPEVEQDIALYLALRKHDQALERFKGLPERVKNPRLREWHVRVALYHESWDEVLNAWSHLTQSQKAEPRWQYWRARALEKQGDIQHASGIYLNLLGRQNYFALLAADRLNRSYIIRHTPLDPSPAVIEQASLQPGIQRAMELYILDREIEARREWAQAIQNQGSDILAGAAVLAHSLGWHDRAIQAAARARQFDDLVLRFPMPFNDLIADHSRSKAMDPAWILALARQESMFMPDVRSPAGAIGLMQIMPSTGRIIAARLQESLGNPYRLTDPDISVRYGVFYLHMRLQELQQNPVLATAAYNAGAHRVNNWLPEDRAMPADIWVENIPFHETRDYIERINTYTTIYQIRLGLEPTRLSHRMPDILPRHSAPERVAGG
ncbi:transglycosylase SLT domain-containing protein [Desulfonatronospira sp.]|uniref:transglycosylase SLT domain-containing protein n=1 Tax=Desulfonatronospira sp. TaxID=1962951 RepID=UPI0025C66625|nr:transglycosylase SLT domain-containing protein [Desulfonatronospira sp.]